MELVGPDAPLWSTNPNLALALMASILSGHPLVVRLREHLRRSMFGDGFLPSVLAERSGDPSVVVHHGVPDAPPPTFEFMYVGIGDSSLHPTPWSCPFRWANRIAINASDLNIYMYGESVPVHNMYGA